MVVSVLHQYSTAPEVSLYFIDPEKLLYEELFLEDSEQDQYGWDRDKWKNQHPDVLDAVFEAKRDLKRKIDSGKFSISFDSYEYHDPPIEFEDVVRGAKVNDISDHDEIREFRVYE